MVHNVGINRRLALGMVPMAMAGMADAAGPRVIGAPDAMSQAVLRRRLPAVDSGPGDFQSRVRSNFPQIIEQNFALRGPRATAELLDGLSEQELSDLAVLYTNASLSAGGSGWLLWLLARRLDDERLVRVSEHFGFGPTYAALSAIAPHRTSSFASRANPNAMQPTLDRFRPRVGVGSLTELQPARSGMRRVAFTRTVGIGKYLNYTPYEIYLDFRTAPVGALGVAGSLWEASVVLSAGLGGAYYAGYEIGTRYVEPLVRNYAPSLYDKIGGSVAAAVDWLSNSWRGTVLDQGTAQRSTATAFDVSPLQIQYLSLGGDFGVSASWSASFSSGGGCHPICIDVSY